MPSYLDLGLIVVVLISALLSMVRGFTREVLAIGSWAAAAVAAYYGYAFVLPYVKPYIAKDTLALAASAAIVFFVTLILVSIITIKISDVILDSKIGALDRTLGFIFGAVRGFLLCAVAFLFFDWLVADKQKPDWVKTAKLRPYLEQTGTAMKSFLPDDPDKTLLKNLKFPKGGTSPDAPADPAEPAAPPKTTDVTPPNAPTNADAQKLDVLIDKAKKP